MRNLTEQEIENIRVLRGTARLSVAALEQRAGLRSKRLAEAIRGRLKLTDTEIKAIFANLETSQPIEADQGHRMLCTRCKDRLTRPGERMCNVCMGSGQITMGEAVIEIDGKRLLSREEQQLAEKLAGMVTPVYDTITSLREEVFERFAQAENASIANANFAESIHDRVKRLEQVKSDPNLRPSELASRIEHCMQELGRQGRAMTEARNEVEDRITALAQALADRQKECDEEASEELKRVRNEVKHALVQSQLVDPSVDLLKSFAGFERICRQMRAKCPHLFMATVRRSLGVA